MQSYEANQQVAKEFFADRTWVPDTIDMDYWHPRVIIGNIYASTQHEYVGLRLAEEFIAHRNGPVKSIAPDVVNSGFRVIGAGINYCQEAYLKHCQDNGQAPDEETLLTALRSPQTIRFFTMAAGMMDGKNNELETWFGLRGTNNRNTEAFIYNPAQDCFDPNPQVMKIAKTEIIRWALQHDQSLKLSDPAPNRCPATPWVPEAWNVTVEMCQQVGLFETQAVSAAK